METFHAIIGGIIFFVGAYFVGWVIHAIVHRNDEPNALENVRKKYGDSESKKFYDDYLSKNRFHKEYKHIPGMVQFIPLNDWEKENMISFRDRFPDLSQQLVLRTHPNPAYNSHVFYYEGKFISKDIIKCGEPGDEKIEFHHSYFTHWMYKKVNK